MSPQPVLPGMQPLSSRLCCRNAGRERGRPSRRPTARTDKAAFLLPPPPAERAACSAVGSGEGSKCQGVGLGYHPTAHGPRALCAGLPTQPQPPGRQKPLSSPGTAKSLTWEDTQPHRYRAPTNAAQAAHRHAAPLCSWGAPASQCPQAANCLPAPSPQEGLLWGSTPA